MFYDSNPWVFAIIDLNQHAFLVFIGVTPTFSNLSILLKIDVKSCPLLGKLLSVWRTISVLPKSAHLPRQLKTHMAFSMFPILDTHLCSEAPCRYSLNNLNLCSYSRSQSVLYDEGLSKQEKHLPSTIGFYWFFPSRWIIA